MKKKILTGIALLSMALITTLNVNAFDPVDGDHDEDEGGGGTHPDYPYVEQVRCGPQTYYQRCNEGVDEQCDISLDQFSCPW